MAPVNRKAVALKAVQDAAEFLRKKFGAARGVQIKADGSLVSEADYGSEKRILRAIRKAFPGDAILSEESGEAPGKSGYRWIVDPLDGTHNFLSGIPIFGVLLALEREGIVILAVCMFPMLDELFIAERGKGAFLNGKRIRVSRKKTLAGSMILDDSSMDTAHSRLARDLLIFRQERCRVRFLGEGPFGMTRVALGTVDAAIQRSGKIWDIAAPSLLVQEAGGKVTQSGTTLVATNGSVHRRLLKILA